MVSLNKEQNKTKKRYQTAITIEGIIFLKYRETINKYSKCRRHAYELKNE